MSDVRTMLCPHCWGSRHEPGVAGMACIHCSAAGVVADRRMSPYFWLSELIHSDTAAGAGIPNDPSPDQVANLKRLCTNLLDPIRFRIGPIHVNSGFRSHTLNAVLGGSRTSAHMEGFAADIVPKGAGRRALFDAIRTSELPFDQLIWELTWVHVGLVGPHGVQRRSVEMAFPKSDGTVRYELFNPNDPRVTA